MTKEFDLAFKNFIKSIDKGPFHNHGDAELLSEKIVDKNGGENDIFVLAVEQAYLDMCRTVDGAGEKKNKTKIEKVKKDIADDLRYYYNGKAKKTNEAFDGWYRSVLSDFQKSILSIGQIQKLINMSFKYLYCCDDIREKYSSHFDCCHMPLDGYTLNWFRTSCKEKKIKNTFFKGKWSKIENSDEYFRIENQIRGFLSGKNVFIEEFIIWEQEKERNNRKQLSDYAKKIMKSKECEKFLGLKEMLDSYSKALSK